MPGRGFPLDPGSTDFDYYSPYSGLPFPRPRYTPPVVEEPPIRRRPRRPNGGRDEIASLLQEIMTTPENSGFTALSDDDDDLVEIVSARPSRPASAAPTPLILPQPGAGRSASALRRRLLQQPQPPLPASSRQPPPPPRDNGVIDLTEEPDSPVEVRQTQTSVAADGGPAHGPRVSGHRHPRRTNSLRLTPPRLARSESIMLASQTDFIDLTGDDDAPSNTTTTTNAAASNEPPRRSNRNSQRPVIPAHPDAAGPNDHLVDFEFLNPTHAIRYGFASSFARGFGRTLADILSADFLNSNPPRTPRTPGQHHHHHHHLHHAEAVMNFYEQRLRPPSPRREMAPLPPTREGFTRETVAESAATGGGGGGEERVVICPACNEELAYDPNGGGAAQATTATGAKKRKRAAGDHHFWAVKKCGHVSDDWNRTLL